MTIFLFNSNVISINVSFRLFPNPRIIFAFNMPLNLTPTVVFQLKITHKLNIKHEKQKN